MLVAKRFLFLLATLFLFAAVEAHAEESRLQPFTLAYTSQSSLAEASAQVTERLKQAGFEVVGSYSPFSGAEVISISSPGLRLVAAQTSKGGFGAALNVSLTEASGKLQVAYQNPAYLAAAYRLNGDLSDVAAALNKALGAEQGFGAKGLSKEKLGKYHYMIGLENFDDASRLASFPSHAEALNAVTKALQNKQAGAVQVYRVDLPGNQQTLFGVSSAGVADPRVNEKHVIAEVVDAKAELKTTAYLPYLVLVDGKDVLAPHLRFQLAVWHPDLTMLTFGKLRSSPGAIEDWLKTVVSQH